MEENKKNFLDLDEIDRIQQEIERSLYAMPQSKKNYYDNNIIPKASAEVTPHLDVSIVSDQLASLTEMESAFEASKSAQENESYHEIKKNEANYSAKGFRRMIAIVVIACTLGTGTLGVGIGVGYPLISNYLSPSINYENSGNYISVQDNVALTTGIEAVNEANINTSNEAVVVHSVSDVIKLAAPSVVSIKTVHNSASGFFSLPHNEGSSGSGIIFHEDENDIFIVTNHHVVSGATYVWVRIQDSRDIRATSVGSNPESDLAVISISKDDITAAGVSSVSIAAFGDSDEMQVGYAVLAIGNAMGEGIIVTAGIISAVDKEVLVNQNNLTVIQTDAAINPGNSGGPLINVFGEVIGINTARPSRADVEGMGYSISSNVVKPVLNEILNQTPRPFLGIQGMDINRELAERHQLPISIGVFVQEIIPDTSAQRAGLRRADVITGFNDASIFSMEQLSEEIQKRDVGEEVIVKVFREGEVLEFNVRLSEFRMDNF